MHGGQNMDQVQFNDKIVSRVREFWTAEKTPILLSTLGSENGNEFAIGSKQMGLSLGVYLDTRLSDKLKVVRHSQNKQRVGVLPRPEADAIQDYTDALLDKIRTSARYPRYDLGFWRAFITPLAPSKRRFLTGSSPNVYFHDVDENESAKVPRSAASSL